MFYSKGLSRPELCNSCAFQSFSGLPSIRPFPVSTWTMLPNESIFLGSWAWLVMQTLIYENVCFYLPRVLGKLMRGFVISHRDALLCLASNKNPRCQGLGECPWMAALGTCCLSHTAVGRIKYR